MNSAIPTRGYHLLGSHYPPCSISALKVNRGGKKRERNNVNGSFSYNFAEQASAKGLLKQLIPPFAMNQLQTSSVNPSASTPASSLSSSPPGPPTAVVYGTDAGAATTTSTATEP
jgi:hypothetical protein